ncbi:hypothetical protein GGQ22_08140 [Nocardioides sp. zg-579]|uniref:Uncharacterized protein n=1 Tax=Nocardioides marmotae TaxID=2663857 RepID=A0A6I3JAN6_9ACTN|nr:hypothetical protein [Nocardioides marmotae]MCR6031416.1 hypothetical protein [Gordonia jinghuaiqii]MTB95055.1 hypothetical protein [Nocardioides marmotae]QKE02448.1 hypothetical protein HPC71_16270 [Nocardioides marmotae]
MSRPPVLGRRAVLVGAAAGALAACTAVRDAGPATSSPAPAPSTAQEAAIFDLSLQITDQHRPFALVAPGFAALEGYAVRPSDAGPGRGRDVGLHDSGPPAPFAAVQARVTPGGEGATAALGLATPAGEHVLVRWSSRTGRVTIEVRTGGRTRVLRRRTVSPAGSPTGTFGLAFALCENQVTALLDTGAGWEPVLTERTKVADLVDLRREDVLAEHRYAWAGQDVALEVDAGVFGMTGLRDPHLVQHADGTPYERDGRVYLTWTCAGLGFFQQAHWTVWSLDPADPRDMRLEGQLFSRRDGLVLGDHAGQVVRDGDRWLVASSSWGDFEPGSIHVRHTETTADVLHGVHVLDHERTPLPTEQGTWDPGFTRVDGAWHVGYVESPSQDPFDFHPVLARTRAARWHEDLEPVLVADDLHQTEGPIIATVEDTTWFLASDGDARHYPVFDLGGRRVGRLDAPYPSNIPHPQLLADPAGGWWMISFEGTQFAEPVMGYGGHGDVVLLHSR